MKILQNKRTYLLQVIFLITSEILLSIDMSQCYHHIEDRELVFNPKTAPITICSDKLNYNQGHHVLTYQGHVMVFQVKKKNIVCPRVNHDKKNIASSSQNSRKTEEILEHTKVICARQNNGCRILLGQKLKIILSQDNKMVNKIVLTAKGDNTAKFYIFQLPRKRPKFVSANHDKKYHDRSSPQIYGQGKMITFEVGDNILTIDKDAYVDYYGSELTGGKVFYKINTNEASIVNTKKARKNTLVLNNYERN